MKKYELVNQRINGLWQIVALIDIPEIGVKVGDLGGWIGSEYNLSHMGICWVSGDAWVSGNARVSGNAQVSGNVQIYGNANVYGDVHVSGDVYICGNANINGDVQIGGSVQIYGDAQIGGSVRISGTVHIFANMCIFADTEVKYKPVNIINLFKFNYTQYDEWIQIGSKLHKIEEWKEIILNNKYRNYYNNDDMYLHDIGLLDILIKEFEKDKKLKVS